MCRKSSSITLWSISGLTSKATPICPRHQHRPSLSMSSILAIGHFVLNNGEIYYNDRQTPLAAEVHDLQTQVSFDPTKTGYDGTSTLSARSVAFGDFNPLQHDFQARFNATPSGLTLSSDRSDQRSIACYGRRKHAELRQSFCGGFLPGRPLRRLNWGSFSRTKPCPVAKSPLKELSATEVIPRKPLLENLSIEGQLDSPELAIDLPEARTRARSFKGEYRLYGGTFEARKLQADGLGRTGGRRSDDPPSGRQARGSA